LDDALVVIEGVVDSVREVGDHVIIFGRVEQARSRMDIEPLVFFRGAYEAIAEKRALIASPSASPI
jgi:flavin reductase (DIM6/NTAB) family NADH-FMN oxidoreductase RutF